MKNSVLVLSTIAGFSFITIATAVFVLSDSDVDRLQENPVVDNMHTPHKRDEENTFEGHASRVEAIEGVYTSSSISYALQTEGKDRVAGDVILDRGNVRVRLCETCEGGFEVDDPYANLSLSELEALAVSDATAAFQLAIRYHQLRAGDNTSGGSAVENAAIRSVALASPDDIGWYFSGLLAHLGLHRRSNWRDVSNEELLLAFKWLRAGASFGFTHADDWGLAKQEIERRGLEVQLAEARAVSLASRLNEVRFELTGSSLVD